MSKTYRLLVIAASMSALLLAACGTNDPATAVVDTSLTMAYPDPASMPRPWPRPPRLRAIHFLSTATTMPTCGSQQLHVVGQYDDGARDLTTAAVYSSSNAAVASVSNLAATRGRLERHAAGRIHITARVGTLAATVALELDATLPSSISLSPRDLTVAAGQSVAFTLQGSYCDGTSADLTSVASWHSSNRAVAEFSRWEAGTYVVDALAIGTSTISAGYRGAGDAIELSVTAPTLQSIFITLNATLPLGQTLAPTASALYSDGSTKDVTALVFWSSSDTTIATIAGGNVTGVSPGFTTIIAVLDGLYSSVYLEVTP